MEGYKKLWRNLRLLKTEDSNMTKGPFLQRENMEIFLSTVSISTVSISTVSRSTVSISTVSRSTVSISTVSISTESIESLCKLTNAGEIAFSKKISNYSLEQRFSLWISSKTWITVKGCTRIELGLTLNVRVHFHWFEIFEVSRIQAHFELSDPYPVYVKASGTAQPQLLCFGGTSGTRSCSTWKNNSFRSST